MDTRCIRCEGSGIYYRPNGEDDFDAEYCSCPEGRFAEDAEVMKVLGPASIVAMQIDVITNGLRK